MAFAWWCDGLQEYLRSHCGHVLNEALEIPDRRLDDLADIADAAILRGDKEVVLPRDQWMKFSTTVGMVTQQPLQTSHLRMWFDYQGVRFVYQIREPTPDDDYVLCLEAAGWV